MIPLGLSSTDLDKFEKSLITGYNLKITLQVLTLDHKYVHDISAQLVDGQVNNSYWEPITSSASLTLLDPDYLTGFDTSSPSDGALYADRMIRIVYSVYSDLLPKWVDVPIFCGPVDKVTRDDAIVSVECKGKENITSEPAMAWTTKTYKKGTKVTSAIRSAMTLKGETKYDLPEFTWKLSKDRSITLETILWTFVSEKLAGSRKSRQLWYDGRGVLRLRSKPTKPIFTFTEDHLLSVPKLDYNVADIRNTAYVKGANPAGKTPQYTAKRYLPSSDPSSPSALGRNGTKRYLVELLEDDTLNTQSEVNSAANDLLDSVKTANIGFEFDSFPMPHLEAGDPFLLSTRDVSITLPLDDFSIPLTAGQPQSNGVLKKVSANAARLRRK